MTTKLTRWGGSTGLRICAPVMEAAGLKVGDFVSIRLLDNGDIRVRPTKNPQIADHAAVDAKSTDLAKEEDW